MSIVRNQCQQSAALSIYYRQFLLVEYSGSFHAARRPLADILHTRVVAAEALEGLLREIAELCRWVEDDAQAEYAQVAEDSLASLRRCKNNLVVGLQGLTEDS